MDPKLTARIDAIMKKHPNPRYRAGHGQWIQHAWTVRGLVEAGYMVLEACRIVADELKLEPRDAAVRGLRQAFYQIRTKPWP